MVAKKTLAVFNCNYLIRQYFLLNVKLLWFKSLFDVTQSGSSLSLITLHYTSQKSLVILIVAHIFPYGKSPDFLVRQ